MMSRRRRGTRSWGVEAVEVRVLLAAKVIVAPAEYEFHDMGFDPQLQEVGIVGYEGTGDVGVTRIAKLFELNAAGNEFTAQTLAGLGPGTQVFGISSDADRIAGVSMSPLSIGEGEGTTWLRTDLSSPNRDWLYTRSDKEVTSAGSMEQRCSWREWRSVSHSEVVVI